MIPILDPFVLSIRDKPVQALSQIMYFVQQLSHFDFSSLGGDEGRISLENFLAIDFTEPDRRLGICHFPLYELTEEDWISLDSGADIEQTV